VWAYAAPSACFDNGVNNHSAFSGIGIAHEERVLSSRIWYRPAQNPLQACRNNQGNRNMFR